MLSPVQHGFMGVYALYECCLLTLYDDDDDDDEIAYFTVRWKTRASFVYRTKNMR